MKFFWKALLWSAIILYLSLIPSDTFPEVGVVNFDKAVHLFIYFIQTILFISAFDKNQQISFNLNIIYSSFIGSVLGGGVELLQTYFTETRQGDWIDAIANTAGVLLALLCYKMVKKLFLRYKLYWLI